MEKIYYEDIHIVDFNATVLECIPGGQEGRYQILLDKTAFFPEEGGQLADKGFLRVSTADGAEPMDCVPVLDVQIADNLIYHIAAVPIPAGTAVFGHVDWSQRFDFMQQHSGEHILSGLIHAHYGLDNVGFHLGLEEVTLDVNGELTLEQLRELEQEANEVIWRNLPVLITRPAPEALAAMEYRSKLDLTENVRIVEIPGVDRCACCAPHVAHTGQIGLLKITDVMRHRGGSRIHILCGNRALADYTRKQDSVTRISVLLSARQEAVADAVRRLQEENGSLKEQYRALQAKWLRFAMQSLPSPESSDHALLFLEGINDISMRNAVNDLVTRYKGYCGCFVETGEDGYRFIIGSSQRDCRTLAAALRAHFQAKGGGAQPMIQGSIHARREEITAFLLQQ